MDRDRRARRCYGFDEIALVPGAKTVNPNEVDTAFSIGKKKFKVPILAAAMDGVVDVGSRWKCPARRDRCLKS